MLSTLALAAALAGSEPSLVNLGVSIPRAKNALHQSGRWTVFVSGETAELCAIDAVTGEARGAGLPVAVSVSIVTPSPPVATYHANVQGSCVVFAVDEATIGTDLNGNGSLTERILHTFDLHSGTVRATGVSVSNAAALVQGNWVSFASSEGSNGDQNGDGDTSDFTAYLFDLQTGATTSLGLAGFPTLEGDRAILAVNEANQGDTDLNGDGDTYDEVLFEVDLASGQVNNLGLAGSVYAGSRPTGLVRVSELGQGVDLNGNGTVYEDVWFALGPLGSIPTNLGLGLPLPTGFSMYDAATNPSFTAMQVRESIVGPGTDVNRDGDLLDTYAFAFSLRTKQAELLRLPTAGIGGASFQGGRRTVVTITGESQLGADQNGDGDAADFVVLRWREGQVSILPLATEQLEVSGGDVALTVPEVDQGQDLDQDGTLSGEVIAVSDFERTTVLPWSPTNLFRVSDGRFFAARSESAAGIDWTGNGSFLDNVLFSVDIATGQVTNHGIPVELPGFLIPGPSAFDAGRAAVVVPEDSAGVDLNGDGDSTDLVLHVVTS